MYSFLLISWDCFGNAAVLIYFDRSLSKLLTNLINNDERLILFGIFWECGQILNLKGRIEKNFNQKAIICLEYSLLPLLFYR